jgi:hypothetical protein
MRCAQAFSGQLSVLELVAWTMRPEIVAARFFPNVAS